MPASTRVIKVAVFAYCHSPLYQPKKGVNSGGKSEIKWEFRGVYFADNHCVVVVQAENDRDRNGCGVDRNQSGGVFREGEGGVYCELTFDGNDLDNWTCSVATGSDESTGDAQLFTAGTGGGGR